MVTATLSFVNAILVVICGLLALFAWYTAKRREFLYFYLTATRPDSQYFQRARQARSAQWRAFVAFAALSVHEVLWGCLLLTGGMSDSHLPVVSFVGGEAPIQDMRNLPAMWLLLLLALELLGFAMWSAAMVYRHHGPSAGVRPARVGNVAGILALAIIGALVINGRRGEVGPALLTTALWGSRVWLLALGVWALRRLQSTEARPSVLSLGLWVASSLLIAPFAPLLLSLLMRTAAYAIMLRSYYREVLDREERQEVNRARLERERQVMKSFLGKIGSAYTAALEMDRVMELIASSAMETTQANSCAIFLYDDAHSRLSAHTVRGFFPPMYRQVGARGPDRQSADLVRELKEQVFERGEGVIAQVAESGQSLLIENVKQAGIMLGSTTEFLRNRAMLLTPLRIRDEIVGVMAVLNKDTAPHFTDDDRRMMESLANLAAFYIENARMVAELAEKQRLERELQIARDIQQLLLPKSCPEVPGFDLAAMSDAALEVGGDFFDFFWLDDNRLGVVVADVSGKGVPAALTMAMVRSVLRSQAAAYDSSSDLLSAVNATIAPDLRGDMFVTMFYGILDTRTRKLVWSRAGHEPLIVLPESDHERVLTPSGVALGLMPDPMFREALEESVFEFHHGDTVMIYTDGITEAMNAQGEEFGLERLLEVAVHGDNGGPSGSESIASRVHAAIDDFVSGHPQHDDITLVLIQYADGGAPTVTTAAV